MRRMRSILAVALFAAAAPMILAEGTDPVETTQQVVNQALDGAQLPPMDAADATAATHAAIEEVKDTTATLANAAAGEGAATLDLTNGVPALTTEVPANAVVINLTPGSKQGCYTIGEATTALAEFCEKDGAAVSDPIKIGGVDYQWVTGSLKNVGGKDLCAFSTEPLKLTEPMTDIVKIIQDDASKNFEHLTLPTSQLKELKLPNAQTVNAQILMPVDVSKITAEAPLTIPGATLSANLQPCAQIDNLLKPEEIKGFTDSLSKLAAPAASPEAVGKAAADATTAVAEGVADATGAAAEATEKLPADATAAADATTKAAQEVADAATKAGEALKPQGEGVATEAISPANSLTASLAGLAAVAAALAFQFVL